MNIRKIVLALTALLALSGTSLLAQSKPGKSTDKPAAKPAAAATATPTASAQEGNQQQQLVRVATLNSVQANAEFQRNVQIMQAQRQRLVELTKEMEAAKSNSDKRRIQGEIDNATKKINEDNQKMFQAYGFTLNRNYTMVVEKSYVYMFVSPEEAKQIEENLKKQEAEAKR